MYRGKYSNLIKEVKHKQKLNMPENTEELLKKLIRKINKSGDTVIDEYDIRDALKYKWGKIISNESGINVEDIDSLLQYVYKNEENSNSRVSDLIYDLYSDKFYDVYENLYYDVYQDKTIYRQIVTSKSISEVLEYSKQNGVGGSWAKNFKNAYAYYAGDEDENNTGHTYVLVGQATDKNINWDATMILRLECEDEDEIRLKENAPIYINKIIDMDTKKRYNINQEFSTGTKYVYNQYINESFAKDYFGNPIVYYTSSDSEAKQMISTLLTKNPIRGLYDLRNKLYIFGDAYNLIHADLIEKLKLYGKEFYRLPILEKEIYQYLDKYCAMFKIIDENEYKQFYRSDGYRYAYIGKLNNNQYIIFRNNELAPSHYNAPDELKKMKQVPLFKNIQFKKYDIRSVSLNKKEQLPQRIVDESVKKTNLNDNFWKWFKGSKVVDFYGNPLIVYHGTNEDFNIFDKLKADNSVGLPAFYFTSDKNYSKEYGSKIMPVYLKAKKLFDLSKNKLPNEWYNVKTNNERVELLKQQGYDGVFDYNGGATEYVVFEPNQIKSINNNGNWDSNSNSIMEVKHRKKLNLPNNSENQVVDKVINAIRNRGWDNGEIVNEYILFKELIYSSYYNNLLDEMIANKIKFKNTDEKIYKQAINYILNNMDNSNSVAYKIVDDIYRGSIEYILQNLENELIDNNIYREINTNMSINELIQHLKKYGTGNCWAKHYDKAESYNGGYDGTSYIFVGQATDKNISWYDSILLRTINEDENEIRLRNNAPVRIIKIIDKNNKKRYNINQVLSTGDKYSYAVSFKESKQNINENKLSEIQEDIKYILSSDAILFSCDPSTYDFMLKCLKQGQKPEYFYFNFYKNRPTFMNLCRSLLYRFTGNKIKGTDELIKKKISSYDGYSISKEAIKVILNGYYGKIKVGI